MAIIAAITVLCYRGISSSALVNSVIVAIKVTVILLFIAFSLQFVDLGNWQPYVPAAEGPGRFGWDGVVRGASIVFYAYLGFDAISPPHRNQESTTRRSARYLGSLAVSALLYVIVAGVLTGMVPYTLLGAPKPVATALEAYPVLLWLKALVEIAAVAGLSSGIIVLLIAQPRIFYAMSQDGLISRMFGRVHERHGTPHVSTIFTGVLAACLPVSCPSVCSATWWQWEHCSRSRRCASVLVLRRTSPTCRALPCTDGACRLRSGCRDLSLAVHARLRG